MKNFLIQGRRRFILAFYSFMLFITSSVDSMAQDTYGSQVITSTTTQLRNLTSSITTLLRVVMGLGALVTLTIVIFKVFKGDREAAEKLAWWVAGLAIGFVLLTVVSNLISSAA
jgi:small-conductance mechanosensitive channel